MIYLLGKIPSKEAAELLGLNLGADGSLWKGEKWISKIMPLSHSEHQKSIVLQDEEFPTLHKIAQTHFSTLTRDTSPAKNS